MTEAALSLADRLLVKLDEYEAWARAASRPYPYTDDEGATVPEGGVHWQWGVGENWDPVTPDPALDEQVDDGGRTVLITVETWPSHGRPMPMCYGYVEGMDAAAAGLIQRHDPASVLRTVAAHRTMIAWARTRPYAELILRALASVYLPEAPGEEGRCSGCGRTSHGFACPAQLEAARSEQDF